MMNTTTEHPIVPRENLDFGLDGDIPRFWLDNDPFKSRFFDAMSTFFPEGERFFISCVRDYRDQITDPKLLAEVKDFTRQEGQHGIVHRQFNNRVKAQGVDVDLIEKLTVFVLFRVLRKVLPKSHTLALTAAFEHMTALMAHGFEAAKVMDKADPRIRAMYTWHAIEEVEHKAVAFDVMQKVAKVGYMHRVFALILATIGFPIGTFLVINRMLKADGFGIFKRTGLMAKGLWWLYKPGGLYMPILGHFMAYFKPGFHPWQTGQMHGYAVWLETFNRTGDPIAAGNASIQAH
ncbi:metal-dependent hydrolase [Aquabacterium sp.]|uniref:metal-dependent hydrolase n=1 Tax=Aquabacterium sp. TaxID=1872578 RepID=UPI0025C49360|nr:metal-dependent hydrolase [Aquabacterium sp.]